MAARVLIDTNVFMYASGGPHRYRDACRRIVAGLMPGRSGIDGATACIDAELFQEIAYRYASIGKPETGHRLQESIRSLGIELLDIDEPTIDVFVEVQREYAAQLDRRGDLVRDLLHLSIMIRNRIDTLISADTDFDKFEGIRRLDPASI